MALDLNAVMDGLGARLATIAGLRVYDYPADSVQVPAAVVSYPETVEYDETFARGCDQLVIPITVVVGKVSDRASRDQLGAYIAGSGARSIKLAVDGTLSGAVHAARVFHSDVSAVVIGAVEYIGATFRVEVWA